MPRPSVRAPATRDQADAYRFGLRRLEAALVRGDLVPLHEQIRSQRRAAAASVLLGVLGLCGTAAHAALAPGLAATPVLPIRTAEARPEATVPLVPTGSGSAGSSGAGPAPG